MRVRDGRIMFTADVDKIFEYNNEDYPGEPFLEALNDYADNAVVTCTLEFVKSLYLHIEEASEELKSLIELYKYRDNKKVYSEMLMDLRMYKLVNKD